MANKLPWGTAMHTKLDNLVQERPQVRSGQTGQLLRGTVRESLPLKFWLQVHK